MLDPSELLQSIFWRSPLGLVMKFYLYLDLVCGTSTALFVRLIVWKRLLFPHIRIHQQWFHHRVFDQVNYSSSHSCQQSRFYCCKFICVGQMVWSNYSTHLGLQNLLSMLNFELSLFDTSIAKCGPWDHYSREQALHLSRHCGLITGWCPDQCNTLI